MMMNKVNATSVMAAALVLALSVGAQANAPDKSALEYSDIHMTRPDFDEPFQRDGHVSSPQNILQVVPGTSAEKVRALIGSPIRTGQGAAGPEWDYDLKLGLADEDFIVCQYKVVFDALNEKVVETAWRRYQCRDAIAAHSGS